MRREYKFEGTFFVADNGETSESQILDFSKWTGKTGVLEDFTNVNIEKIEHRIHGKTKKEYRDRIKNMCDDSALEFGGLDEFKRVFISEESYTGVN